MSRNLLVIILLSLACLPALEAQNKTRTLADIREAAVAHYPANRQKALYRDALEVSNRLLNNNLLPQLTVTGQATYQSEVTSFEFPGAGAGFDLPRQTPDQYRIGVEARYNLTDFAALHTQQRIQEQTTQTQILQADVTIQRLKEQIGDMYANVLLLQQNKRILQVRIADIDGRVNIVESAVRNGASLRSNLLVLQSDQLSTQQRIDEIDSQLMTLMASLQVLTGLPVDTSYRFELPVSEPLGDLTANRPETQVFAARRQTFDLQNELLHRRNRPLVYLFAQGNYGRPGYNFLNNDLRLYGIAGVGLNWNINNLVNQKHNLQMLRINAQQVTEEESLFNDQLQLTIIRQQNDASRYQTLIQRDSAIVANREAIVRIVASQLENGAITSTDYLTELNALNTARLNEALHQVQLMLARENLRTTLGN